MTRANREDIASDPCGCGQYARCLRLRDSSERVKKGQARDQPREPLAGREVGRPLPPHHDLNRRVMNMNFAKFDTECINAIIREETDILMPKIAALGEKPDPVAVSNLIEHSMWTALSRRTNQLIDYGWKQPPSLGMTWCDQANIWVHLHNVIKLPPTTKHFWGDLIISLSTRHIAESISNLINSRPRSPTIDEIEAVIRHEQISAKRR